MMEKLDKVIAALTGCIVCNCSNCEYFNPDRDAGYTERLMEDALELIEDLRSRLDDAKNGRLELARKYQVLKAERDDLRKDVEAQGEIILELNRDLKRCREALNAQGEYKYLGGDLISREALMERIENIDWYHEDECGKSTVMRQGACSEEEAWFKAPDIFAAVRDALAVEAEPVVHAHWEDTGSAGYKRCSHCKEECAIFSGGRNYCPNCGAHMDEEVAE